jgi:hypothetical protein
MDSEADCCEKVTFQKHLLRGKYSLRDNNLTKGNQLIKSMAESEMCYYLYKRGDLDKKAHEHDSPEKKRLRENRKEAISSVMMQFFMRGLTHLDPKKVNRKYPILKESVVSELAKISESFQWYRPHVEEGQLASETAQLFWPFVSSLVREMNEN